MRPLQLERCNLKLETRNLKPETGALTLTYQVIYATSNIADELDISEYTIGDKYSPNNKSLKNV